METPLSLGRLGNVEPLGPQLERPDLNPESLGNTACELVHEGVTNPESFLVELTRVFLNRNGNLLADRDRALLSMFVR